MKWAPERAESRPDEQGDTQMKGISLQLVAGANGDAGCRAGRHQNERNSWKIRESFVFS